MQRRLTVPCAIMNAVFPNPLQFDLAGLADAMADCHEADALRCRFSPQQWAVLASFLQPMAMTAGQVLMKKGALDRTVYLIEAGTLSAHYEDEKSRLRMALIGAGTVVGEGSFFSHLPRRATVTASSPCKLWGLNAMRFAELSNRHCAVAQELTLGMGGVLAKRLYHRQRRVAVT